MADPIDDLFSEMQDEVSAKSKQQNADKCQERIGHRFSRVTHVVPASGNVRLARLISRPQSIEGLQDLVALDNLEGALALVPVRVLGSGRGARWIACTEPPRRVPHNCVVITVAMAGALVRVVPEPDFIEYWGDNFD